MYLSSQPKIGTSSAPGHTHLKESRVERELDEALMDTFPASDPPAVSMPHASSAAEDEVDEAIQESFPASDPGAVAQPRKK